MAKEVGAASAAMPLAVLVVEELVQKMGWGHMRGMKMWTQMRNGGGDRGIHKVRKNRSGAGGCPNLSIPFVGIPKKRRLRYHS